MPDASAAPSYSPAIVAAAGLAAALLAAAAALWAYYGTAVFTEMILAGLAYCF